MTSLEVCLKQWYKVSKSGCLIVRLIRLGILCLRMWVFFTLSSTVHTGVENLWDRLGDV